MLQTGIISGKTNIAIMIKTTKLKIINAQLTSTKRATLFYSFAKQRASMRLQTKVHSAYLRYMITVQSALKQMLSKTPITSEDKHLIFLHPSRRILLIMG